MKEIILATDFSSGSIHALNYAITIANKTDSNITMLWVDSISEKEGMLLPEQKIMKDEICEGFADLIKKHQPLLKNGNLSFKIRKGKIYNEIALQAKQSKADLVIAGAHGISGFEEYWIGSNAFRIVSSVPCPIITIRNGFSFSKGIKTIVLPLDITSDTLQKIYFTADLAEYFAAEIHILALYATQLKSISRKADEFAHKADIYLKDRNIKHQVESVFSENTTNAILTYADAVKADVISIMTEQENNSTSVLLGPHAQQMINQSEIPILSIKPASFYDEKI